MVPEPSVWGEGDEGDHELGGEGERDVLPRIANLTTRPRLCGNRGSLPATRWLYRPDVVHSVSAKQAKEQLQPSLRCVLTGRTILLLLPGHLPPRTPPRSPPPCYPYTLLDHLKANVCGRLCDGQVSPLGYSSVHRLLYPFQRNEASGCSQGK